MSKQDWKDFNNKKDFNTIRMAGVVRESIVDGPGLRLTVFCQGCPHGCKGCHNQETHDFNGGKEVSTLKLLREIRENTLLDGVTFSGGEPFEQAIALTKFAELVKSLERDLNIVTYTGYTFEELLRGAYSERPEWLDLLEVTDILIDGGFVEELKSYELKYRGSSNQRYLDCQESLRKGKAVLKGV